MKKEPGDSQARSQLLLITRAEFQAVVDLYAAAIDVLAAGAHDGECEFDLDGKCNLHLIKYEGRINRLKETLNLAPRILPRFEKGFPECCE